MSKFLDNLYKKQSLFYKYFIYIIATVLIVFFFPKGGKFKYEFQKGKPWQYENYYAPFDFSIKKTSDEIQKEKQEIKDHQILYYTNSEPILNEVYAAFDNEIAVLFENNNQKKYLSKVGKELLDELYKIGVVDDESIKIASNVIYLIKGNVELKINTNQLNSKADINGLIHKILEQKNLGDYEKQYQRLFFDVVKPNVFYDPDLSKKVLEDEYSKLSNTRGTVDHGKLIIAKGEVVESENYKILNSIKSEFESELWAANNYYFILFGY